MTTDTLVFRRVRVIDPAGALDAEADVVIERGRITRVGRDAGKDIATSERVRVVERVARTSVRHVLRSVARRVVVGAPVLGGRRDERVPGCSRPISHRPRGRRVKRNTTPSAPGGSPITLCSND